MVIGHHLGYRFVWFRDLERKRNIMMEKFDLRRPSSQAKSAGIIMAVSGPFVMTLYKRPPLLMASSPSNLPHRLLLSQQQPNWVLGGFFLGVSCISSSIWNIAQAIYGTVFQRTALTWCQHKKGPVFVAMFKPTIMVIAVVFELIFLSNAL